MDINETNNMPVAKKSNILNIVIIILVLALVAVFFVGKGKDDANDEVVNSDNATSTTSDAEINMTSNTSAEIPMPVGTWTSGSIKNEITFDVPPTYYLSRPVIGECSDVVSISTQTTGAPTLPIAIIYKEGCVTDPLVTGKYTHREVKNGYVFQTNASNSSVVILFNKIVASAK